MFYQNSFFNVKAAIEAKIGTSCPIDTGRMSTQPQVQDHCKFKNLWFWNLSVQELQFMNFICSRTTVQELHPFKNYTGS